MFKIKRCLFQVEWSNEYKKCSRITRSHANKESSSKMKTVQELNVRLEKSLLIDENKPTLKKQSTYISRCYATIYFRRHIV